MDFRALLNKLDEAEGDIWKAERRVQDNGRLTNFNIDRDDPFRLFKNLGGGGDNYSRDDIVKVYYKDDERLALFRSEGGRNAVEVDNSGNEIGDNQDSVGGADAQADADAAVFGSNGAAGNGNLRLSDGTEYFRDQAKQRELNQRAGALVRRVDELIRKMNESIPNSLKGYLSESDKSALLFEALTSAEEEELRNAYADLRAIASFQDDQGYLISPQNQEMLTQRLDSLEPAISSVLNATPAAGGGAEASTETPPTEAPPEAERASDASGDQDATVDPGEGETAGSLEAFANSGKGGLANDPDEVDAIRELQQYLTDLGFDPNGVDGKYGRGTIAAVKEFQEYFGAAVDGDAGPETIGKIIQLRGIRWGEGGSKDFAEWRRTMTRMEELIGKAGNATESTNLGFMRSILETLRRLDEALSDSEADELQGIIDELRSAYDDGEFTAALPPRVAERFTSNFRAAEGVLSDMGRSGARTADMDRSGAETDAAGNDLATMDANRKAIALHDGLDGAGTDEEAILAVLGSIADNAEYERVKAAFQSQYNEDLEDWLRGDFSFGEEDEVFAIIQRLTGEEREGPATIEEIASATDAADALHDAMKGGFFFGLGTEEQALLAILGKISARTFPEVRQLYQSRHNSDMLSDLSGELSGTDKQRVNDIIKRFGFELVDEDPGYKEIGGDTADGGDPVGGEPNAQGNVEPRPTGSDIQNTYAAAAWDDNYGETHNPDGTPKATATGTNSADAPRQVAANAGEVTSADDEAERATSRDMATGADAAAGQVSANARARAQAFIDRIGNLDNMSEQELDAMLDDFMSDEEAFGLLPANLQQQLRDLRG